MKKLVKYFIRILVIVVLFCVGFVGIKGFIEYKKLSFGLPISEAIAQVESSMDYTPYDEIPHDLIRATVAIEDRRFYDHGGVDYIGLTRAIVSQVFPYALQQSGGSTITQQLAKNLYGMWDSTVERKASEFFFAKKIENSYTKQQIITYYLNIINYGNGYIGIRQAANGYFDVEPEDLTIAQCTLLAGIPQSPSNYQLNDHFQQAKEKQYVVLKKMVECHYIHENDVDTIYNMPV